MESCMLERVSNIITETIAQRQVEAYTFPSGNWHYYDQTGDEVCYKEMTINGKIYYFSGMVWL